MAAESVNVTSNPCSQPPVGQAKLALNRTKLLSHKKLFRFDRLFQSEVNRLLFCVLLLHQFALSPECALLTWF